MQRYLLRANALTAILLIASVTLAQASDPATSLGAPASQSSDRMIDVPLGPAVKVTIERRGQIVLIGINRPDVRNRLDPDTIEALGRAYFDFNRDSSLRAAVLFGYGASFCRGLDVEAFKEVASGKRALLNGDGFIDPYARKQPALTKPLVVAVHGDTWNGGHELFLAADVRVAAENTEFGQDENLHGRFPGGGATVRFPREAGWGNAMRYILTGEHWTAQQAYRMGLVQEVSPTPESALDRAITIAERIATNGPLGVQRSLASAHSAIDSAEAETLSKVAQQNRSLYKTRDFQEGRDAEAEGRPPVYLGR